MPVWYGMVWSKYACGKCFAIFVLINMCRKIKGEIYERQLIGSKLWWYIDY